MDALTSDWPFRPWAPWVIHGTIEVTPGGESKRRIGDEVKVYVDFSMITRQPTRIMVADHLVDQAATLPDVQPSPPCQA
jgi:hypothetical protein